MQLHKHHEFGNESHNNKVNFEPSGLLAKESNSLNGVFLKDARVVNISLQEESVEDQHAVIQHRINKKGVPTIYIIDLDSKNGTFINDEKIEQRRYYELIEKDSIRFGNCKDEFILLHDEMI
ncbi:forkhead domain-containing protein [Cryptosporidium ubiquitum]|uniref:Forkhead domain-containing protein n=1 Tax=Cryptosporidium ubiquitum TaxID=857276 RepID=A0A1J4MP54_9CRYT|nr:forkhead domain-containing protein [Cryptosporidium ubiquitum]OII74788.1 forkhead domain-containing protein [Cryptosporidium ubiquitum]